MAKLTIRFLSIIMTGLISGILLGILIGYNPQNLTYQTYVELQQNAINALNTLMPILGLITILLTISSAFLQRENKIAFRVLMIGAVLLIASGLVTRFGNQPINATVMTWDNASIPDNWTELRDQWWSFHKVRTGTTFLAFCLILGTNIRRS